MALNKAGLTAALTVVFEDLSAKTAAQAASDLADAVDTYVRTAAVVTGVTGVATPSGDAVTGTGTGGLS